MLRDYLTKLAILSQLLGVNYDNNYAKLLKFGAIRQKTGNVSRTINGLIGTEWVF